MRKQPHWSVRIVQADFIRRFKLPMRLRDADVPEHEIDDVADIVHGAMERAKVVDRPVTREEMRGLLHQAY